jgi:hypothetical protein
MMKSIKLSLFFLIASLFIIISNVSFISAGTCRDSRGNYYYCEKYSRYSDCEWDSHHGYYNCDNYYTNRNIYYDYNYEFNYSQCNDYHYFNDVYEYDAYRHYCMSDRIYNAYFYNYGNTIKVIRPSYRSVIYYDYQNDPLYPDYYISQVQNQDQNKKLKPLVIYVS